MKKSFKQIFCLHFRHWHYVNNLERKCLRCGRKESYQPFVPPHSSDLVIGIGRKWMEYDFFEEDCLLGEKKQCHY